MNRDPFIVRNTSEFTTTSLVKEDGEFIKEIDVNEAIQKAKEASLDLVCFTTKGIGDLALCKIIDYGKWKYQNDKRRKKQQKERHETKEVRFSPVIQENDLLHKLKHVREFIDNGHEVVLSMRLKRRTNRQIESEMMDKVKERCEEFASVVNEKRDYNSLSIRINKKVKK